MKNSKRILKVVVKRMVDTDSDTSYLGHYSNRPESEYAIDRAHSEYCASVSSVAAEAAITLEHAQKTVGDIYNAVLAQYNGTLANKTLDAERDALDETYDKLGELTEEVTACDCGERGNMGRNEYRYFNGPIENYKGESPEDIRKYVRQDYERMESLNRGDWWYIGIRAEAKIAIEGAEPSRRYHFEGWDTQTIVSGGLWGIESDSGESYLQSIAKEELANLREQLKALGFSARAISTAFKNVQEVSE